jgi:poly(3-hydroxybutyrate) depolymerase
VVPLIVFQGDRDHTVQAGNAAQLVREAEAAYSARAGSAPLQVRTETGTAAGGRRYSRSAHLDAGGRAWVEHWTVHGAGHAWSGGDARGSYTDSTGPDASAEMLRFFLALPRAGSA